ncbi:hydroxymethylglutaryl-CoA reductase [Canibacter sp. lx-72]|uniref:hydroxymethylglutaryl-CoA reductase n=1 Tax=Canibacter zhuwentaonis TaxID=2837491 RepID=UPI001BDBC7D3|nr:hydroxymethylglutaryl-CoA reductase [Canibacter zhuwentaonis]MBT1018560.1 hydroxymethylglutaryl-CoA reductase [Canibacter zhuwentaonis]
MSERETLITPIPTQWIGPLRISGNVLQEEVYVPLATYETPLWPSVGRGASISREVASGITVTITGEKMTRSVIFTADSAVVAVAAAERIEQCFANLAELVVQQSRFAQLTEISTEIVGNLLFVRFAFTTGDASGHNMVTAAAEKLMNEILSWDLGLSYGSISGNVCADKKPAAVNSILGRGKAAIAEIFLPHEIVTRRLRSSAAKITELSTQKNLVGSILAGSVRAANAHYANMLLGVYLATGQDAANIVEGSQGITYAQERPGGLYFSCTLSNLIMGTVGNGKNLCRITENLRRMGCAEARDPGENARRLAAITAATVLCGELSLLAAQTNPGELMATHVAIERKHGV